MRAPANAGAIVFIVRTAHAGHTDGPRPSRLAPPRKRGSQVKNRNNNSAPLRDAHRAHACGQRPIRSTQRAPASLATALRRQSGSESKKPCTKG